ncbi:MAG: Rab family GTPase [Candidatus Thorarchaeota archaeon]
MLKYKIILAGSKDVGKSSLITRFCDDVFHERMMSTIGVAFKKKKVNVDGKLDIELNIWDFGGEERYRTLFPSYCNGASAALILYDTTDKESLKDVENWVNIIDANAFENVIKVLIGSKIDLKDKRVISMAEAKKKGEKFNCFGDPIETSSKTGENVEIAFLNVCREILSRYLQPCKNCGKIFSKKLNICNYCGQKIEIEAISQ